MITYQDLLKIGEVEQDRQAWVYSAIQSHKCAPLYRVADVAQDYFDHKNRTINEFRKLLYTVTGRAVVDNYSANYKMANNYFHRFVVQETQYLLGNGVTWGNDKTADKLGEDFDTRLQEAARDSLIGGEAFGFWNYDHMEVFKITEFVPIYDETNGALMAGIRFWQIDSSKPLRASFYEIKGVTEYMWDDGKSYIIKDCTPYITHYQGTDADGMIYDYRNYPTLPIVPIWGNLSKQSELIGLREQIDCYDLIKSGFANDVDDASLIYWTIQNAGGMDDVDLARFVERMKTVKAAVMDDNAKAEAHTMDVPYESREALLDRLERDLYKDAMALDVSNIASGATTATQIKAAYEPLNSKCDDFEYCVLDFLRGILKLAEIEDEKPTFTRSMIANATEELNAVLQAAHYLPDDYVTTKILNIMGDGDMVEDIIKQMEADEMERLEVQEAAKTLSDLSQENLQSEGQEGIEEVEQ